MKTTQSAYNELIEIANQLEYNVAAEVLSETLEEMNFKNSLEARSL